MGLVTCTNTAVADHEYTISPPHHSNDHPHLFHHHSKSLLQTPRLAIIFVMVVVSCLLLFPSSTSVKFPINYNQFLAISENKPTELKSILKNAATSNNTIILTTLNYAWTEPDSMFDLFIESFQIGNQTQRFLKHLVVVSMDQKSYARCLKLHPHCYNLSTEGMDFSQEALFMAPDYLKMMWRRTEFLHTILDLGYNFIFTDADIMWFRDPFPHFYEDGDFQIACDYFIGNPIDLNNIPNGGFIYVKSNNKTIQFYKYWLDSRLTYPGQNEQDVFNKIKFDPFIRDNGLQIRFLDTMFFGGLCKPSKNLNKVCTMHGNCCYGLENKVHDLKIMLQDWRKYMQSFRNRTPMLGNVSWTVPQSCRGSFQRPLTHKKKDHHGSKS